MTQKTNTTPTYAPLLAQRRRRREAALDRREQALTVLYDRSDADVPTAEPVAIGALLEWDSAATRPHWHRLRAVANRFLGGRRGPETHRVSPSSERRMTMLTTSSARTEAALAQRITGPGSGSYSGTPFPLARGAVAAAGGTTTDDAPCEAMRHDHGIIDPSRHVSSVGRR